MPNDPTSRPEAGQAPQTAGAESAQHLDTHPRPSRAPAAARTAGPTPASSAAAAGSHECTPTEITKTGSNGDEERFRGTDGKLNYIGNFHKGLRHNQFGEVDPAAYEKLLEILKHEKGFDQIPLDLGRKLTNPQSGLATDLEGPNPKSIHILAAPSLDSAEEAAEAVELYWMALLRDVPFTRFASDPDVAAAAGEISNLKDFTGPKAGGKVTPQTLFRGCSAGDTAGPLVSQYLLADIGYGALNIVQREKTVVASKDYLTKVDDWLPVQNGSTATPGDAFDPTPRYIRNMRDIGQYVHVDALYEAYLNACLILLDHNAPFDPGNPYVAPHPDAKTQIGFGTFGGPHILSLVTEVATRALKAVWWQKWFVHRRLRPEAFGGLAQMQLEGVGGVKRDNHLHPQFLNSEALKRVRSRFGSYLLPIAFPEGSPTHPAYGAGHATVAGACVTILKAWFDEDVPLVSLGLQPVVASDDGIAKPVPYTGPDAGSLTVGGELNKVAANIAIARNMAGVHWRSDYTQSALLGERVALHILSKQRKDYHERDWSFTLRSFEGDKVTINRDGVFKNGKEIHP